MPDQVLIPLPPSHITQTHIAILLLPSRTHERGISHLSFQSIARVPWGQHSMGWDQSPSISIIASKGVRKVIDRDMF
jgi:hypothetical protein